MTKTVESIDIALRKSVNADRQATIISAIANGVVDLLRSINKKIGEKSANVKFGKSDPAIDFDVIEERI